MNPTVHQLVVLANGELRIPDAKGQVTHGHRSPDHHIKIVMPANQNWLLVELEVEPEEVMPPSIASKIPT